MRRLLVCLVLVSVALMAGCREAPSSIPSVAVRFSPKGGCAEAIVRELDNAKKTVLVQAYSFTSAPIAKALVEAQRRGVDVQVILDKSQETEKYSSADFLLHADVPVRIDARHAIAHNKIMILDGEIVVTGSFNFTKQAEEHNAENLLVIRDPTLAQQYTDNWRLHADHSEPYLGRKERPASDARLDRRDSRAQPARPDAKATGQEDRFSGSYVASLNSGSFHRPECKSAAKISGRNLVIYATRDEAIQAGKTPCQECRP